ncbi:Sec-independent protein translocase protein TatB [Lacisediminimonas profundi]|uniref:Sec-independent protein translocase protein TatB n=1 Tax=Lacisediminimonas profundi TaxID=2603856 RepID=UPI00124B959C|nr:Sec-independent protein translocase protein TatB [Lacisediminimonas profundi]
MIDLGLTKIALIGAVALVVIGPEKLPKLARMAGSLFGRAQRYINDVKAEVSREIELDELRKMQQDVKDAASSVEQTISSDLTSVGDMNTDWDGGRDLSLDVPLDSTATTEKIALKARDFRKKKILRQAAVPGWYKQQSGRRSRVLSGAARVARFRPPGSRSSNFSFH